MKLALGTAQFGQIYGVANTAGQIDRETAASIIRRSQELGWDTLDTAIAYGESESILGSVGVEKWKVISKLPVIPDSCRGVKEWLIKLTQESLERLRIQKLSGLLLHRPSQLSDSIGPDLYGGLLALKDGGLVERIGVSIYAPSDLEKFWEKYRFDVVQAPLNILDRRMVESGWAHRIKSSGAELHVRSVFLQGLMLMPSGKRPLRFEQWSDIWDEWDRWLRVTRMTPIQACLRYVNSIASVDRLVVGVDSVSHLEEIAGAVNGDLNSLPTFNRLKDERLINPAMWNQL
jgi:aryl-alcohol dehydrogenase-like predicted oxidoreductase